MYLCEGGLIQIWSKKGKKNNGNKIIWRASRSDISIIIAGCLITYVNMYVFLNFFICSQFKTQTIWLSLYLQCNIVEI